jgi:serine/threonine protein kinase
VSIDAFDHHHHHQERQQQEQRQQQQERQQQERQQQERKNNVLLAGPGSPWQDLPSPTSVNMLGRQWSGANSRDGADSVHFVPASDVKVLAKIGEGAFGEVSLATVPIFGKVAVKWLKPKKLTTHNQAFWQEAELLGTLNHPHVIRFFGVVVESPSSQQVVGIITEYLASGSLSALLHSAEGQPPLPMRQRAELALGAANGMSYLHELRVVHFDLKPDNLLVDGDLSSAHASVKVADFGLSKHKYTSYVTGCRDLRGTLPYMAPELISDPDHVTEKADVWSMGIVLWELVARQVPYADLSPQQIVAGLMKGCLRPKIPEWVEDEWRLLIESCLDFNPQARPSFRELSSKLERVRDEAAFLVAA